MKCVHFVVALFATALVAAASIAVAAEGDKPSAGEIKIQLKDFKFKPPEGVADPDSVFNFNEEDQKLCFYTNGPAEAKFSVPTEGDWDVIISASGDSATIPHEGGKEEKVAPKFQLGFDSKNFGKEITLKSDDMRDYTVVAPLKAGEHVISVAFTNDMYDPDGKYDSNFFLNGVKLRPHKAGEPSADASK
jgi:Ca-dependent carbohydrate-binding module xylan-binding